MIILIIMPFLLYLGITALDSMMKEKIVNNEPEDELVIIDHIVKEQYGPTASWSLNKQEDAIKISHLETGTYPILVKKNGIISYTKVGIDVDTDKTELEEKDREKPDEIKSVSNENGSEEKLEDFNPLKWFQKPEIRDAVRLLKTSNHSEFLIPEDYLPDKKYWPKIQEQRLILGFKMVRIENDGISVLIDD